MVEGVEKRSAFGCRWGHFYSKRLVEEVLGLGEEGVVRVSLVHYNTGECINLLCRFDFYVGGGFDCANILFLAEEEVREFVKVLDEVLAEV